MYFKIIQTKKVSEITEEIILKEMNELKLNSLLNYIFGVLLKLDVFLIKNGVSLLFGGSLIAVAKKKINMIPFHKPYLAIP